MQRNTIIAAVVALVVAIVGFLAGRHISDLGERVTGVGIASANMSELAERVSRTQTAVGNWLDVDDALAGEDYPDATMLRDRLNIAAQRWPQGAELPERVVALSRAVERYYETGENARRRVL